MSPAARTGYYWCKDYYWQGNNNTMIHFKPHFLPKYWNAPIFFQTSGLHKMEHYIPLHVPSNGTNSYSYLKIRAYSKLHYSRCTPTAQFVEIYLFVSHEQIYWRSGGGEGFNPPRANKLFPQMKVAPPEKCFIPSQYFRVFIIQWSINFIPQTR